MADLENLSTFGPAGMVHVVVEASRGMTAKCKYDKALGLFVFGKPLPHGLIYRFDWGFIPSTQGGDGDPLDALVRPAAAGRVGGLIRCKPVAVLQVSQREAGEKAKRNHRFILRPAADQAMKERDILGARLKRELEQFFDGVSLGSGKTIRFLGWRGPSQALAAIRNSAGQFTLED
jgi:inorganic pyrophosphatase